MKLLILFIVPLFIVDVISAAAIVKRQTNDGNENDGQWKGMVNKEMTSIFNSMSTMWQSTIDSLKSTIQGQEKEIVNRIQDDIDQAEIDLNRLWNATKESCSDFKQQYSERKKEIEERIRKVSKDMGIEVNDRVFTFDANQADQFIAETQKQLSTYRKGLVDRLKSAVEKTGTAISNENAAAIERLERMQMDVNSMWTSFQNNQAKALDEMSKSVSGTLNNVWNDVKSITENCEGMINGYVKSAQEQVQKASGFFKDIYKSIGDTISNKKDVIESESNNIQKSLSDLSEQLKSSASKIANRNKRAANYRETIDDDTLINHQQNKRHTHDNVERHDSDGSDSDNVKHDEHNDYDEDHDTDDVTRRQIRRTSPMDHFLGQWRLVSSENLEALLKEQGIPGQIRDLMMRDKPVVDFEVEDEDDEDTDDDWEYEIKFLSPIRDVEIEFRLGRQVNHRRIDGQKIRSVFVLENGKLIQSSYDGSKTMTVVWQAEGNRLMANHKIGDVEASRTYEKTNNLDQ